MAELGSYYITIMPSMKGFTSAVNKELGSLGSSGGKSFSSSFVDVVKGSAIGTALGNLAMKAGSAITDGLKTGIGRLDTLKNFPKVMEGLGYSTQEADKSIKMIMEHLDGLPTSTQDMVTLTQAISDSTGDLDLATRAALGFNDMMLANGAGTAEMANAQGVLNRVLGKGSATAQQWQSICSVMPAQLGQVARHMLGAEASTEDLHAALENGTVSWNDFLKAIVELDEKGEGAMASFHEQAINNSVGIGTALENIPNRIGAGWAKILEAIGQQEISTVINDISYGIRDALGGVADIIERLKEKFADLGTFEKLQTVIGMLGDKFKGFADAVSGAVSRAIPVIADLIDRGLQWIIDHGDSISNFIDTIAGAFGKVGEVVGGALSSAMPVIGDLVDKALTWILDHGEVVVALLGAMAAKMAFEGVASGAKNVLDIAHNFETLASVLPHLDGIKELPALFSYIADQGGPLAGLFGKLSTGSGGLMSALGNIKSVVPGVSSALGAMGGSASGLGSTLAAVATGPIGIAIAAIVAIGAAIKTLWDTNEGFRNTVTNIWNGIVSKFQEATDRIGKAFEPIAKAMGIATDEMGSGLDTVLAVLGKIWEFISNALGPGIVNFISNTATLLKGIIDVITGIFEVIGGVINGFMTGDWTMFTDGLKSIWDGFITMLSAPFQGAIDAIKYTLEQFGINWDELIGGIKAAWDDFIGFWTGLFESAKTGITDFVTSVGEKWDGLKSAAGTVFGGIRDEIGRNLDDAKTVGTSAVNVFTSAITGDWEGVRDNAKTIFETVDRNITDHLQSMKDSGIPIVSDLASAALDKWNWLKTDGVAAFEDLAHGISDKLGEAKQWAEDRANEIKEFWEGLPDEIVGFFTGLGDRISDAIGNIHFPTPHISWEDVGIGGVNIPIPHIEWYAKGGVFDSATLIGVGEKGREAALPLNAKTYGEIAKGISDEMGGSDVADEIRALRDDVRALQLVVQLDTGAVAGGVYPYIDSRMETQRRREAMRR
jgi:tape measure domain-containing protein